jgi:hypothetical protein
MALVIGAQDGLRSVINAAKRAAPEAKWSQPIAFSQGNSNGFLIKATSEYRIYSGEGIAQQQRPQSSGEARTEPRLLATITNVDQLLAVPTRAKQPTRIDWPTAGHEPNLLESDLGVGQGYHWYGRGSLAFLASVRRGAKLSGGEDPRRLYIRALAVEDYAVTTRNTAVGGLYALGDSAVPELAKEIARDDPKTKATAIQILTSIRTRKAALELVRLFQNGSQSDRERVSWLTSSKPYRPEFKPIYAYSLGREGERAPAARAITYFGWKECLPQLRKELRLAKSSDEVLALYEAADQLGDKRLSRSILDASAGLIQWHATEHSVRALMQASDKTHVALIGVTLLHYQRKGETPFPSIGVRLLDTVPAKVLEPIVERFHVRERIEMVRKRGT